MARMVVVVVRCGIALVVRCGDVRGCVVMYRDVC